MNKALNFRACPRFSLPQQPGVLYALLSFPPCDMLRGGSKKGEPLYILQMPGPLQVWMLVFAMDLRVLQLVLCRVCKGVLA